jgi:hypothetical protein
LIILLLIFKGKYLSHLLLVLSSLIFRYFC